MGILLASANFDLFLDKVESGQRLADARDSENPLYRFVRNRTDQFYFSLEVFTMHTNMSKRKRTGFVRIKKTRMIRRAVLTYQQFSFSFILGHPSWILIGLAMLHPGR